MQNKILNDLLIANDFELIENVNHQSFGDFYSTYSNGNVLIRIVKDRSSISVALGMTEDKGQWFDLSLVKALIFDENVLNKTFNIDDSIYLLKQHLEIIKVLFSPEKYSATKILLENLEILRMQQMFPSIKIKIN